MTGAYERVSALEHQIIAESLRRVAILRPDVAMVLVEILEAGEYELGRLAHALTPDEARSVQPGGRVIAETKGQA